ncbi:hypothetical protein [uncultured Polaribacter sp.]|uniref:hypothetical protein n=1 Tax=uncultured Polaribacter sp. TaxID=174711 RepID=UPI002617ADF7|nr:hypothetical protein [uncultured Polaribacter sp.]
MTENNLFSFKNCLFLSIFSIFNWFLEIVKWHTLVNFISKISFFTALKQSLAALTTSLITPNRIGEYGAKAMYFDKNIRKKILSLNLIGNLHQLFATCLFGVLGLFYFLNTQQIHLKEYLFSKLLLFVVIIVLGSVFVWKYVLKKQKFLSGFKVVLKLRQHLKINLVAIARYLVFAHQFYFLLFIFKVDVTYVNAISAIASIYLISSFIPMLSLFDAVLKSSVAIFIFSYFKVAELTILTITTLMWILNFVIPAIFGSYFVLTFKPNIAK